MTGRKGNKNIGNIQLEEFSVKNVVSDMANLKIYFIYFVRLKLTVDVPG